MTTIERLRRLRRHPAGGVGGLLRRLRRHHPLKGVARTAQSLGAGWPLSALTAPRHQLDASGRITSGE